MGRPTQSRHLCFREHREQSMLRTSLAAITAALMISACDAAESQQTATPFQAETGALTVPSEPSVEPDAVAALRKMSAYLSTLDAFEADAKTSRDMLMDNGQKLQLNEATHFKAKRGGGFVVERKSDRKHRTLTYDGAKLTLLAPRMKFYAQVDAPPTIHETLDMLDTRYGIEMPLEDLFRWNDADAPTSTFTEAYKVGYAVIGGADTDHYAFRQPDVDWQIWIERGATPLPRKIVITTLDMPGQPQYAAELTWSTSPNFAADTFKFVPPADAHPIAMTALDQ
jgi:hypothetical protein